MHIKNTLSMVCVLNCYTEKLLTMVDWRDLTANFHSGPEDYHEVTSLTDPSRRTIPFVAVGLNSKCFSGFRNSG